MVDSTRVLRLHLALTAIGSVVLALIIVVVLGAVSFQTPTGVTGESHWQLLRAAVTVDSVGTLVLGSLGLAVLLAAADSLWRQQRRSRAFLAGLEPLRQSDGLTIVADKRPLAFCAGLRQPRVYVSTTTVAMLSAQEFGAVLAHEGHHVRRHDPLRVFAVRALADALFFLPVLHRLSHRYSALVEVGADRAAVASTGGDPAPLASALLAFDENADSPAVGIDPMRVDHLCGEPTRWQLPVTLVAWTALVLCGVVVAIFRAAQAGQELVLNMALLAQHICLFAVGLGPLVLGAVLLLRARSLIARRVVSP